MRVPVKKVNFMVNINVIAKRSKEIEGKSENNHVMRISKTNLVFTFSMAITKSLTLYTTIT